MSEESRYLIYFIEQYALSKGINGEKVYNLLNENNLLEYIKEMYNTYHTERVENAIADIDSLLKRKPNDEQLVAETEIYNFYSEKEK